LNSRLDTDELEFEHGKRTAKRRQALLASNLLRNSCLKLIRPRHGERSREVSLP
jgi:hypothetical protein